MVVDGTPVEHFPAWDLFVKHEEQCCPGGPHFSKTRGVYAHAQSRPEKLIGVLDTAHSRGGHAVARACNLLGKQCVLYFPLRKHEAVEVKPQQRSAEALGAKLVAIQAGRSAVLYHHAKHAVQERGGYMFPNALKLDETVAETKKEFLRTAIPEVECIIISASSGTIAAGVLAGAALSDWNKPVIIHLGYSRPARAVRSYLERMAGVSLGLTGMKFVLLDKIPHLPKVEIVDEGYEYKDEARPGETPPWPCDAYYDLKAFRWWLAEGRKKYGSALLWNVG